MTIEELRIHLHISEDDDSYDETIEALYEQAKRIFTHRTRIVFEKKEYTEVFTNVSSSMLFPQYGPLVSVTSIRYKNNSSDDYTDLDFSYTPVSDTIYMDCILIAKFVEVVYEAGYETIPLELDKILAQICSFLWTYDDRKVMLSGTGEAILVPDEVKLPKIIRESMAIYRIGI